MPREADAELRRTFRDQRQRHYERMRERVNALHDDAGRYARVDAGPRHKAVQDGDKPVQRKDQRTHQRTGLANDHEYGNVLQWRKMPVVPWFLPPRCGERHTPPPRRQIAS